MLKILIPIVSLTASLAFGQDTPMSAAPGQPPPPQGWELAPNPNGGVHLPKKKRDIKTDIQTEDGDDDDTAAQPTPTPTPRPKAKTRL